MKNLFSILLVLSLVIVSCQEGNGSKTSDDNNASTGTAYEKMTPELTEKISYMIGSQFGKQMLQDSLPLNFESLLTGIKDAYNGKDLKYTEEELMSFGQEFDQIMKEKKEKENQLKELEFQEMGEKNKTEGPKVYAEFKSQEGVEVSESGLAYKMLVKGDGSKPSENDYVKFNVIAKYFNGQEFDNSYTRDPVVLPVKDAMKAWNEAFQMMNVGSKMKMVVPPDLGFGEAGAPPTIPANAYLIFELELLDIVDSVEFFNSMGLPQQQGGPSPQMK